MCLLEEMNEEFIIYAKKPRSDPSIHNDDLLITDFDRKDSEGGASFQILRTETNCGFTMYVTTYKTVALVSKQYHLESLKLEPSQVNPIEKQS